MAKELVKYSKITAAKGSMKKWYVGMGQRQGGRMPMPTTIDAAVRGLLR